MASFKRTTSIRGSYKDVVIVNNAIVDAETGEEIDLIGELQSIYGSNPFDISTSLKMDMDIDPSPLGEED